MNGIFILTTEECTKSSDEEQANEEARINYDADHLLQILIGFANKGASLPVTLFVGGNMISGLLIGRREYFDVFTTQFTTGWEEEEVRQCKEGFGVFDEPEGDEDEDVGVYEYIHLRDAKAYAPGQQPLPANGLLWRGRLSAVGGFSYGVFGPAPAED